VSDVGFAVPYLAALTWREAEIERAGGALVLLPIGATEAHGPHLPLETDTLLSLELAERVGRALRRQGRRVVIAPAISYSVTEYGGGFAGTVSIKHATAVALVADVCVSLVEQGFRRVCLLNNHLEPAHVECLKEACTHVEKRTGIRVLFPDQTERRFARTLTEEYKRGACHAGSYETSLLLAKHDGSVRPLYAQLEPHPTDLVAEMRKGVRTFVEAGAEEAYFGDPAAATVTEGEWSYERLVEMALSVIEEAWPVDRSAHGSP
jgi:creatinine amidohydrolase